MIKRMTAMFFLVSCMLVLFGCNSGAVSRTQNNMEMDGLLKQTIYAPTSAIFIDLPDDMKIGSSTTDAVMPELKPYLSNHGTSFPPQQSYFGESNKKEFETTFRAIYMSYNVEAIQKQTGQPFTPNLDGGVAMYTQSMERVANSGSQNVQNLQWNVKKIIVDNMDARLVTMQFNKNGYPIVNKMLFVVCNDDMWEIGFNCNGKSEKSIKLVDKILVKIKFMK